MHQKDKQDFSCSLLSSESNEKIFGTAPKVDVWFLLEYPGAWSDKAFVDSKIPENVKTKINEQLDSLPNSRLQLIKRQSNSNDKIKVYVGLCDELEPKLYEVVLSSYEELLDLDIKEILNDNSKIKEEPLFLVCTNGAYDKCCGKHGVPVFVEAVKNENGFMTWQCTHLGGHRFAANFLHLPYGLYYGRVRDINVTRLIQAAMKRDIYLENYRGRSCYSKEAQAAEYFLRSKTGIKGISAFRLNEFRNSGKETFFIEFISHSDNKKHLVHIQRDKESFINYTSCKDEEKSPVTQYKLIECKEI